MYHHTEGIFLCERIFGTTITVGGPPACGILCIPEELCLPEESLEDVSEAVDAFVESLRESMSRAVGDPPEIVIGPQTTYRPREVPVRLIAELHIMQDLGWIPSPQDYIDNMELKQWMGGSIRKERSLAEVFPTSLKDDVPSPHTQVKSKGKKE